MGCLRFKIKKLGNYLLAFIFFLACCLRSVNDLQLVGRVIGAFASDL